MIAVFVNMATVFLGSLTGIFFRNKIKKEYIDTLICALALITVVIGISSAIKTADFLCLIICLVIGTLFGMFLKLNDRLDSAGEFIKSKLPKMKNDRFTEGFVSACILFCVGSMTIIGSFEAGISGNYDIIFAKSALDFVSSMMFGASMGIGVTFSIVFILLFQGGLTLLAGIIAPFLGNSVIVEMSAVGGTILIGMGINMLNISDKKITVANMFPAIFLPVIYVPLCNIITKFLT